MGIFSDPSFLFYLDFLSRKLSFLCSLYICSGYHLQFGVLRVFPGSGIIYCEYRVFLDNVLFIFPVQEAKFFMFYLFLFRISLKVWSVKGLSWTGIIYCDYRVFQDNVLFFPVKETLILICVISFCSGNLI